MLGFLSLLVFVCLNICFAIDENGILSVSAEEKTTDSKNQITINNDKERLSTVEIRRMVQQAHFYRVQDMTFLRIATAKNDLDLDNLNHKISLNLKLLDFFLKKMDNFFSP